jgi:tripartite-type tricarboxylate transporter receptor subunit TctC
MSGMRTLCLAASLAATLLGSDANAQTQSNYPNRPIHVVVP